MQKNSYNYNELIECGEGKLFGEGNAKLPLPPMLMFDRITEINKSTGEFKKGFIKAELDIKEKLWFFDLKSNKLTDIDPGEIKLKNIPKAPKGKSIKDIDVVINIDSDYH